MSPRKRNNIVLLFLSLALENAYWLWELELTGWLGNSNTNSGQVVCNGLVVASSQIKNNAIFFGLAAGLVGSLVSDQGLNPVPQQ